MKTRTLPAGRINSQNGYTYILVLAALIIVGIMAGMGSVSNRYLKQRDAEQELIFRGLQYISAIKSYYHAKKDVPMFPRNLEELETDPRFAHKQHIRRLYNDPITGDEWQLIRSIDGGISGVVSTSKKEPLKKAHFPLGLEELEGAQTYSEWFFEYKPPPKKKPPAQTK